MRTQVLHLANAAFGECDRVRHEEEQPMRTLASFILISLDGFYEGPNG